jgi:hypothetical protein
VQDFQFYVTDDRYEVRSLLLVTATGQCRAHHIAERILAESHHHAVEVWRGDAKLYSLGDPNPSEASPPFSCPAP